MQGEPELVPVTTPRNMKQLRNLHHKQLQLSRISHDDMYNLHEIAYDIPGYIHKIITFPDLVCVCGVQEVLEELDRTLLLGSSDQLLSYDTTFQLGDFYVSPLLFRHTLFKENPCIPAMFLIHECKFVNIHKAFTSHRIFLMHLSPQARAFSHRDSHPILSSIFTADGD